MGTSSDSIHFTLLSSKQFPIYNYPSEYITYGTEVVTGFSTAGILDNFEHPLHHKHFPVPFQKLAHIHSRPTVTEHKQN